MIERECVMQLLTTAGLAPIEAKLSYDVEDPHAVYLTLKQSEGVSVIWAFSRELLLIGHTRSSQVGQGDIRIRCCAPSMMHFYLRDGQDGDLHAHMHIDRDEVKHFLAQIYKAVPHGRERMDFDAELEELLR